MHGKHILCCVKCQPISILKLCYAILTHQKHFSDITTQAGASAHVRGGGLKFDKYNEIITYTRSIKPFKLLI